MAQLLALQHGISALGSAFPKPTSSPSVTLEPRAAALRKAPCNAELCPSSAERPPCRAEPQPHRQPIPARDGALISEQLLAEVAGKKSLCGGGSAGGAQRAQRMWCHTHHFGFRVHGETRRGNGAAAAAGRPGDAGNVGHDGDGPGQLTGRNRRSVKSRGANARRDNSPTERIHQPRHIPAFNCRHPSAPLSARGSAAPSVATAAGEGLPGRGSPAVPPLLSPSRAGAERSDSRQRRTAEQRRGRVEASCPAEPRAALPSPEGQQNLHLRLHAAQVRCCRALSRRPCPQPAARCRSAACSCACLTPTCPQPGADLAVIRSEAKRTAGSVPEGWRGGGAEALGGARSCS